MLPWLNERMYARINSKPAFRRVRHSVSSSKLRQQVCRRVTCNRRSSTELISNHLLLQTLASVVECLIQANPAWSFPVSRALVLGNSQEDILSKVGACLKGNNFLPASACPDSYLSCKEIQLL